MESIFKNAYFGKAYRTRDGRKAIFLRTFVAHGYNHYVSTGDLEYAVRENGKVNKHLYPYEEDIVSEWQEEINEDEYEDKIKSLIDSCIYWEAYEDEPELFAEALKELLDFAPNDKRTIDFCADMIKSRKTIFNEVNKAITSFIRTKSDGINEEELKEYAESVSESFWSDDLEAFDGDPREKEIYYACKKCYEAGIIRGYNKALEK